MNALATTTYTPANLIAAIIGNKAGAAEIAGDMLSTAVYSLAKDGRREKLQAVADALAPVIAKPKNANSHALAFAWSAIAADVQSVRDRIGKLSASDATATGRAVGAAFVMGFTQYHENAAAERAMGRDAAKGAGKGAGKGSTAVDLLAVLAALPADALVSAFSTNAGRDILATLQREAAAVAADVAVKTAQRPADARRAAPLALAA